MVCTPALDHGGLDRSEDLQKGSFWGLRGSDLGVETLDLGVGTPDLGVGTPDRTG